MSTCGSGGTTIAHRERCPYGGRPPCDHRASAYGTEEEIEKERLTKILNMVKNGNRPMDEIRSARKNARRAKNRVAKKSRRKNR